MKILFDYLSILCFFIAFKIWGIYTATAVAIGVLLVQVIGYAFIKGRVERVHLINLILLTALGGTTLLLHDMIFIKWKPTIVYWVLALLLLGSHWYAERPFIERVFDGKLNLPRDAWERLNISWSAFFFILGGINVFVMYHFSTDAWVNFKLFGTLGLTLLFCIGQSLYIKQYLPTQQD